MNRWRLAVPERKRLGLVYTREPMMHLCCDAFPTTRTLPPHPLQRLGQRLAAKALRLLLLLRKLADGEVYLLLAGAPFTEGYAPDLHLCATEARALCLTAHLAASRVPHRLGQENFPPTGTAPPASHTHATGYYPSDRPHALPAEEHIQHGNTHSDRWASVRWQACTPSLPPSWLPFGWCKSRFASLFPSFAVATPSALAWQTLAPLAFCILYYNYTTRRAQGMATLRLGLRVVIWTR